VVSGHRLSNTAVTNYWPALEVQKCKVKIRQGKKLNTRAEAWVLQYRKSTYTAGKGHNVAIFVLISLKT